MKASRQFNVVKIDANNPSSANYTKKGTLVNYDGTELTLSI